MVKGLATNEGTKRFKDSFKEFSDDFFNLSENLYFSSLGVGSFVPEAYREENYTFSFKDSIKEAIANGVNVIDTAPNYRYQQSHREIAEAIKESEVSRESLIVSTKVGFIELDFPFPDPYKWINENLVDKKLSTKENVFVDQYCIEPDYVRWSFENSLKNLDLESVDILYLHNPEFALGYISYDELLVKIKEVFKLFEEFRSEGKIKFYGVATWNAFTLEESNMEYISIKDLVDISKEIGSDGFKYLQMPYNLAKPHPFAYTNQRFDDGLFYTPFQIANKYGLSLITSSTLLNCSEKSL
jgi:aryl-alcohol dehydrogenase-like predicted oxidoreductase